MKNKLIAGGAPQSVFHMKPVSRGMCRTVRNETAKGVKEVDNVKQLLTYDFFMASDLSVPCTFGVSSQPNDGMAKRWALDMMSHFLADKKVLWIPLYGTYKNTLRDKRQNCDLLILSNVLWDSTPIKIELCRDMLELNQHIPRIVVTSGCNALEFFNEKINFPLNGFVHLQPRR